MTLNITFSTTPILIHAYLSKPFTLEADAWDFGAILSAIVVGLEEWHHLLGGAQHLVTIYSDHKNLEYFMGVRILNHHHASWSLSLPILILLLYTITVHFKENQMHYLGNHLLYLNLTMSYMINKKQQHQAPISPTLCSDNGQKKPLHSFNKSMMLCEEIHLALT